MPKFVYKIMSVDQWDTFQKAFVFTGSAIDLRDGFIHLSDENQVSDTLRLHFAHQTNLVILQLNCALLVGLRYEPSRNGDLFPHCYGSLPINAVVACFPADEFTSQAQRGQ